MANNNQPITEADITLFLDKYVTDGKDDIKALLMNIKKLKISDWIDILWSERFRQIFKCKSEIYKKLGDDVKIFEELLIHIPLNYTYWRDGILNGQLFPATDQKRYPINWAHAIATCIVLLKKKIIGSDVLTFEDVKTNLVNVFGCKGCNVKNILPNILPQYQLHYRIVPENEVNPFSAYKTYHFYICTFYLTGSQWNDFSNFFCNKNNIHKAITYNDLNITKDDDGKYRHDDGGHAVVLIDANSYSYTFLNSWGDSWGNHGKFSVARGAIKDMKFYDIYNLESELSEKEKLLLENRRKKATDAFYQNLDLINLLSPDENKAEISKKIENQDLDTVYLKEKLTQLYKEYWKQE